MSSRISAKASDAKATVSFNSDSEDDDDNSASSRLSSSGEDDVSDVETVTFSVSLAPKNKGETADSARVADREPLQQEPKAADKGAVALPKTELSPNNVEMAETRASEYLDLGLKKSTRSNMEDADDELKVTRTKNTNVERARSPKITINDVDSPEVETAYTEPEKASKKTRGSSPRKIASDDSNEDFNSYSASASRSASERAISPQKPSSEDEIEFSRPAKKSSKVISGLDFDETAAEEPVKQKSKPSSRIGSGDRDTERSKSPKKNSEERELSMAKSLKKKTTSEDKDFLRETSPRNSPKEGKRKSSKDTGKALDGLVRSTESPENSRLEINQDFDDVKESSTKVKKTKKPKHPKHEDGKVKVRSDKTDGEINSEKTGERLHSKEPAKNEDLGLFYGNNLAEYDGKDRHLNLSKYGLNPGRSASESEPSKSRVDEDLEISREISKKKRSELNKSPEGRADDAWLTTKATGKTGGATLEGKTPGIAEGTGNESSSRDLNYLKVDDVAENPKELVNEDSDFTYRRKSMDDFIKRILAEAREEKLKQKQVLKNDSTAMETSRKPDDQRNGDVQREILGKPPRWNGNTAAGADKETSNLDKRLASIEKRRFGGNESAKGEGSKVKEEDGKRQSAQNDTNDLDVNLDEDLEEINRFLQARKSAAARFDEDETPTTTNELSFAPTAAKQQTSAADDGEQTAVLPTEAPKPDAVPASSGPKPKSHKAMKKYGVDLNLDDDDDDDDGRFLARFKRERDAMLSETLFSPRRRDETDEVVRERTRNVRVLVDAQVDIIQSMRNTSKSLDELEKEIREARQVCLDRQVRIEALEGALGAEYRAFENGSQLAGSEGSLKDELGGRVRRQSKLSSESVDEDGFGFRRRSGSVASVGSFGSAFGGGGSDLLDVMRPPPSGYRQQRVPDLRRAEFDAEFQEIDRRRAGSVNRDYRGFDVNPFGPPPDDATGLLLNQRPARSRASIATSSPTLDLASGDGFLAKIRAKYSFLAPSIDSSGYLGSSGRNQGVSSYSSAGLQSSLDLKYARPLKTKDFLTSSISPSPSYTPTYTPTYYSVRDSRSPSGVGGGGGFAAGGASWDRMRRAQSVSEFSFDRPSVASGSGGGGGEFHSRFLEKVRERKASMGDDQTATQKGQGQAQEKPFKSRFLRTSSFDSSGSRSDRVTNGESSEVTVDA